VVYAIWLKMHQSAFHSRSTGVPQKGHSETMKDNGMKFEKLKKYYICSVFRGLRGSVMVL
jgi:hypothetical protein